MKWNVLDDRIVEMAHERRSVTRHSLVQKAHLVDKVALVNAAFSSTAGALGR
jgi:hypothetical protein